MLIPHNRLGLDDSVCSCLQADGTISAGFDRTPLDGVLNCLLAVVRRPEEGQGETKAIKPRLADCQPATVKRRNRFLNTVSMDQRGIPDETVCSYSLATTSCPYQVPRIPCILAIVRGRDSRPREQEINK